MIEFIEFLQRYPDILQAVGVVGFLAYIIGFKLVQTRHICGNGIPFALINVVAACLVLVSLIGAFNLASFLIQISYIAIGLFGIALRLMNGRRNGVVAETELVA